MPLAPLGKKIVVEILETKETKSGLLIAKPGKEEWQEELLRARVIELGVDSSGDLEKDNLCLIAGHAGKWLDKEISEYFGGDPDKLYRIVEEEDVWAVYEPTTEVANV